MVHYLCEFRQIFIYILISLTLLPIVVADNETFAASSEEARLASLIEGAKKEGEVAFYCAMSMEDTRNLVARFREKYPFIKVELYRADNASVLSRLLMESRAKRRINDVVMTTGDTTYALKENGILTKYLSPESKFYPEGFKDSEGYWTDHHLSVHSLVYNTRLVPPKEIPVKYKDLLHPKWKGKLGINLNNHMWTAAIMDSMGEQAGLEFLHALAQQNPMVRRGGTLSTLLVAAGELSMAVSINANNVEEVKAKGASVDWARLNETFYAELHPVALNAFAPHPNAAKLLIDFTLSQEGQELAVKLGQISSRTGMRPSYIKAEGLKPLMPTSGKDAGYYQKLIKKIFTK